MARRTAVINGRLSQRSFEGYRRIRPLVSRLLRSIDRIAVQDETYAERFLALGARPEAIEVTGSMKYDGARPIVAIPPRRVWPPWQACPRMTWSFSPAARRNRRSRSLCKCFTN